MARNTDLEKQISELMTNTDSIVLDLSELIYKLTTEYPCFIPVSEGLYYKGTNDLLISNTHPDYPQVKQIIDQFTIGDPRPRHIWLSDGECISIAPSMDPKNRFSDTPHSNLLVLAVIRMFISHAILDGIDYHYGHFTDMSKEKTLLSQYGLYDVIENAVTGNVAEVDKAILNLRKHKGDTTYASFGMMLVKGLPQEAYQGFLKLLVDSPSSYINAYLGNIHDFVLDKPWSLYDVTYHGDQVMIHRMGDYRALEWVLHQIDLRDEQIRALKNNGELVDYHKLRSISALSNYKPDAVEIITPSRKGITVEEIRSYVEVKDGVHYYL